MPRFVHFTRIPGCERNHPRFYLECPKKFINHEFMHHPFALISSHYAYWGETIVLAKYKKILGIFCNNCNPHHKISAAECELIQGPNKSFVGVLLQVKQKTYLYTLRQELNLYSILNDPKIQYDEKLVTRSNLFFKDPYFIRPLTAMNIIKYYAIFCPVETYHHHKKTLEVQRKFTIGRNNDTEIVTEKHNLFLTYGWNIFYICDYWSNATWCFELIKELVVVRCDKPYFKMFILYDQPEPPSLINLCYSNLFQTNQNNILDKNKYILPKILCDKAPFCYYFHLNPEIKHPSCCCHIMAFYSLLSYNW
jgi:hypothetical protein